MAFIFIAFAAKSTLTFESRRPSGLLGVPRLCFDGRESGFRDTRIA